MKKKRICSDPCGCRTIQSLTWTAEGRPAWQLESAELIFGEPGLAREAQGASDGEDVGRGRVDDLGETIGVVKLSQQKRETG